MFNSRAALIAIRLVLVIVSAFYSVLKLIHPEATPYLMAPSVDYSALGAPSQTDPGFTQVVLLTVIVLGVMIFALTVRDYVMDFRRYATLAPYSSPSTIALLTIFTVISCYRALVAVLLDAGWLLAVSLAVMLAALSIYEGRQYAKTRI